LLSVNNATASKKQIISPIKRKGLGTPFFHMAQENEKFYLIAAPSIVAAKRNQVELQ
jgi:hypothetical protein